MGYLIAEIEISSCLDYNITKMVTKRTPPDEYCPLSTYVRGGGLSLETCPEFFFVRLQPETNRLLLVSGCSPTSDYLRLDTHEYVLPCTIKHESLLLNTN